jgi:hypothetical protein
LKATAVAVAKFEPEIVTVVFVVPLDGLKLLIVGVRVCVCPTVKLAELIAVPILFVTAIGPLVAPYGTRADS